MKLKLFIKKLIIKLKKKDQQIEPIVFVNNPIDKENKDVIGLNTIVKSIKYAIHQGADMIGLIADYGSGKSSIVGLLDKNKNFSKTIKINLWDSLEKNSNNISNLTKSFLYQLASGKTNRKGKSNLANHINKRMSKNFGIVSISTATGTFGAYFIIAAIMYLFYLILNIATIEQIETFIQIFSFDKIDDTGITNLSNIIKVLQPSFLILSIILLVFGVKNNIIAYSHGKDQGGRETEINDIFDIYNDIITNLCKYGRGKRLIIIEDLDRIKDKNIVIGFLKELYRFQNLLNKPLKDKIIFIVSVKPESELNCEKSEYQENCFPKLFNFTMNLKPIHFEDYETILLSIIKADLKIYNRIQDVLEEKFSEKLPPSFYWLMQGNNLTIRDLKDRLNKTLNLFIILKNKKYQIKAYVNFKTCAAVTYLETQYSKQFYELIKKENEFGNLIRDSYKIRNSNISDVDKKIDLAQKLSTLNVTGGFNNNLVNMLINSTIDEDFRMYFYNYPKGSYIKTSDEKDISNLLLLPMDYIKDELLDEKVQRITDKNFYENIIIDSLKNIKNDESRVFPKIILANKYFFESSNKIDFSKTLDLLIKEIRWTNSQFIDNSEIFTKLYSFTGNAPWLISYANSFPLIINNYPFEEIIKIRTKLIEILKKDIVLFKKIFIVTENKPIITEIELETLQNISIAISLIDINGINNENIGYIGNKLNESKLLQNDYNAVQQIYQTLIGKIDNQNLANHLYKFLNINNTVEDSFFAIILKVLNNESIVNYINLLPINNLTEYYLKSINELKIDNGLSQDVLEELEKNDLYLTYICSLYAQKTLVNIKYDEERVRKLVLKVLKELNEYNIEIIYAVRTTILSIKLEIIENYRELFLDGYPLIQFEELKYFINLVDGFNYIDGDKVNQTNCSLVYEYINLQKNEPDECYKFFEIFNSENIYSIKDTDAIKLIISNINFDNTNFAGMSNEQKENSSKFINNAFELTNANNCLDFMKKVNCLIPSLEKIVIQANFIDQYKELINTINNPTETTMEWVINTQVKFGLSPKITNRILEYKDFEKYIVGKTLYDVYLTFDLEKIRIDNYVNVYVKYDDLFDLMTKNDDFLQNVISNGLYIEFDKKHLEPLYKFRQPLELFKYIAQILNPDELEEYLTKAGHLDTNIDSKGFLEYFKEGENYKKLLTARSRWLAKNRLWEPGQRQSFTKFMDKKFAD